MRHDVLESFKGGDRRSVRGVPEVVARVLAEPELFPVLFDGMSDADPLVRMRSADAVEKITALRPEYLRPFKKRILKLAEASTQQEVRWHLAQLLSRLELSRTECHHVAAIMSEYLQDKSSIVRTFAMQTLADIATQEPGLRTPVVRRLTALTRTGSPAMKSRGRRLLEQLKQPSPRPPRR